MKKNLYNPVSVYRLQFHKGFSFRDAEDILPYLHLSGIKTIYASPVFQAVKGSMHGYDITNPLRLNSEIGGMESFDSLIKELHERNMGWLQDFVPNHMAYSTENPWIYDLLKKGKQSKFYSFFDIITDHPDEDLRDRIMLPFFGEAVDILIKKQEISVKIDENGFKLCYYDDEYPVSDQAYPVLFSFGPASEMPEIVREILGRQKPLEISPRDQENFYNLYQQENPNANFISECLAEVNTDPSRMKELMANLAYIPVYWKDTEKRINFRRFFTINGLICLNIQDEHVFRVYHEFADSLLKTKHFDGLRIDHIDGLADPTAYLEALRNLVGDEAYLIVEKILEEDEKLPDKWPVQGSTGYDFLAMVNNLLSNKKQGENLFSFYRNWSDESIEPHDFFHDKKRYILYNRLKGELEILNYQCRQIPSPAIHQVDSRNLEKAIAEFMIYFPVYKMYNVPSEFTKEDKERIKRIFREAIINNKNNEHALLELQALFLLSQTEDENTISETDAFFRRCMQFTGPLMAKGIEDTAFYSYIPFIAYNEVGDNPAYFGITTSSFHKLMEERHQKSPMALNTTSTHDTKRGEDARARLNVLSDISQKWREVTRHWETINVSLKSEINFQPVPSSNDEYFIYQTLCAHLPMEGKIDEDFKTRLEEYLVKAFREAKVNSSWSEPDTDYENKTLEFLQKILSTENDFLHSYLSFVKEIIPHGIINSVTQLILKNTVPGIPDTFQGCETWNLSFVDPDNRRPVDYKNLSGTLEILISDYSKDAEKFTERLWENTLNGFIKQWVTYLTLQERVKNPDMFLKGAYIGLKIKGEYKDHIISFLRKYGNDYLLIVLPLNTATLPENHDWKNTRVKLPRISPPKWENRFTKETLETGGTLMVKDIFNKMPFGMLRGRKAEPVRKAGILMHVSSLPGLYGIGDFGPVAMEFIDFLNQTGQSYWQVLPLNQSDRLTSYSPYSSYSAFAGNTLFTDPLHLSRMGLVDESEVEKYQKKSENQVDYPHAEEAKNYYLEKAYLNFRDSEDAEIKKEFNEFQNKEKYWLYDFALFLSLKRKFDLQPWNEWPEEYRNRNRSVLESFAREHQEEIQKIIFKQFIFSEQWALIREYANEKGIEIFGDIPIYIDYDSADVWSHQEFFRLKGDNSMEAVAGVPPDYFNENGQLWGMPLFNWMEMKKDGYSWWINRIRKNLEWFDLIRLDHFRGFSAYWEVPADAEVALHGKWVKGPANDLFDVIKEEFPDMPFVAEDLGQIDQDVYDLRDHYKLPGMRVLQFGFEENMPYLQHTPLTFTYNSIAYTGTHDNNTMKGWYRKEADKATLKRFKKYTGKKLKEKNCHKEMIRVTYSSVAKISIIPIQDWLGLDEKSRMNFPSTTEGNWLWKLKEGQLSKKLEKKIRDMVRTFGRI